MKTTEQCKGIGATSAAVLALATIVALSVACGNGAADENASGDPRAGRRSGPPGGWGGAPAMQPTAAVPVEVATVRRRSIAAFIETNGTLEAENEVDVVSRTNGPLVELRAEEGQQVATGELLARLEQDEIRAALEISRVELEEARLAYERAQKLQGDNLISREEYDRAKAAFEAGQARFEGNQVQFNYTEIRAPFAGLIVARYVDRAQQVTTNQPLFRLSDFTPLLCPIQVPERELSKLRTGQPARVVVEAWPDQEFAARVLRISPVVDAATGTIKVTLEVDARNRLRPGMFARVYLETERRDHALVMPRAALSLESIGDVVYVIAADQASRREVRLGFEEGDDVEVLEGLDAGDAVVVVGQDGLSEGTPVQVFRRDGVTTDTALETAARPGMGGGGGGAPGAGPGGPASGAAADAGDSGGAWSRGGPPGDFSSMTPEQIERIKQRMRERGLTDEQIEERLQRAKARAGQEPAGDSTGAGR